MNWKVYICMYLWFDVMSSSDEFLSITKNQLIAVNIKPLEYIRVRLQKLTDAMNTSDSLNIVETS
jgi:hypothetical protein